MTGHSTRAGDLDLVDDAVVVVDHEIQHAVEHGPRTLDQQLGRTLELSAQLIERMSQGTDEARADAVETEGDVVAFLESEGSVLCNSTEATLDDQGRVTGQVTLGDREALVVEARVVDALKAIYDPEIPVDIFELGLIYKIDVDDDMKVDIDMTLTAPGCPVAGQMPGWVEEAVRRVPGVKDVKVTMTFDPPWDPSRMSEEAKLELNMF